MRRLKNVFSFRPSRVAHPSALHSYALAPALCYGRRARALRRRGTGGRRGAVVQALSARTSSKPCSRVPAQGAGVPATFVLYPTACSSGGDYLLTRALRAPRLSSTPAFGLARGEFLLQPGVDAQRLGASSAPGPRGPRRRPARSPGWTRTARARASAGPRARARARPPPALGRHLGPRARQLSRASRNTIGRAPAPAGLYSSFSLSVPEPAAAAAASRSLRAGSTKARRSPTAETRSPPPAPRRRARAVALSARHLELLPRLARVAHGAGDHLRLALGGGGAQRALLLRGGAARPSE